MKRRCLAGVVSSLLVLAFVLTGCPMDDPLLSGNGNGPPVNGNGNGNGNGPPPLPPEPMDPPASGTATGTGIGWGAGEDGATYGFYEPVVVTVTMEDGLITEIGWSAPHETPGIGDVIIELLIPHVIRLNRFNLINDIDAIAAHTLTFNGFRDAGEEAVVKIKEEWSAAQLLYLSLDSAQLFLVMGEEATLLATVRPAGTELTWTSSDPTVVTVDQYGEVTAVGPGMAVITVTTELVDGEYTYTRCFVFVF